MKAAFESLHLVLTYHLGGDCEEFPGSETVVSYVSYRWLYFLFVTLLGS